MFMIWALRRWRARHGPTCLPAPLLFAGWSTTTVSTETTSPDSTQSPETWTGPIQKIAGITLWTVPTLVSSPSAVCPTRFMLELNQFLGFWMGLAGHGAGYQPPKCSDVKLDAITTDDAGKMYAFAGNRVLISIQCQSLLHYIQALHSCLLQAFASHHWPPQDPSTCAWTLGATVSMPFPSLVCGRRWLEGWMLYFPTVTKCTWSRYIFLPII